MHQQLSSVRESERNVTAHCGTPVRNSSCSLLLRSPVSLGAQSVSTGRLSRERGFMSCDESPLGVYPHVGVYMFHTTPDRRHTTLGCSFPRCDDSQIGRMTPQVVGLAGCMALVPQPPGRCVAPRISVRRYRYPPICPDRHATVASGGPPTISWTIGH
jgi:hypothetical protein